MVWCTHCGKDQPTERDDINGFICCTGCGRVHEDNIFSSDPTFVKSAGGQSQLSGNFIRDGQYCSYGRLDGDLNHDYGFRTDSHLKTLEKGKEEIEIIAESLCISGREAMVNAGHRLYIIAVERNFTRGRRTKQVAAACLYIVCRKKSHFCSSIFQMSYNYVLGAVFLQLCKLLRLEQHPIIQKPVDPSLFIHRFTDRLLGRTTSTKQYHAISNTALRILSSMKRDWMQTGRKPSGVCGAALYISALSHGFGCTKADVVSIVHICEATLTKRLIEFEKTESGSLTTEEFVAKAKELEAEMQSMKVPTRNSEIKGIKGITELLCEHKGTDAKHFAHGLCSHCYNEFVKVSGGIHGGSAPPAFQRAEEERRKESLQIKQDKGFFDNDEDSISCHKEDQENLEGNVKMTREKVKLTNEEMVEDGGACSQNGDNATGSRYKNTASTDVGTDNRNQDGQNGVTESCISEAAIGCPAETDDWSQLQFPESYKVGDDMGEELETLSDIDDEEVDRYLHNEEEVRLKTIIWTEMNKEYLEEQATKEEAIAAAEAAHAAALAAAAEGAPDAVELAAAAAAAVARLKKDKQRKRAEEAKNKVPPQSAAEATRQMLEKKKLSSKVNYDVLERLFEDNKKNVTQTSDGGKDIHNQSPAENVKRTRSVLWADEDSADFKNSKRQALQGEATEGNAVDFKEEGAEFKEERTDPNMEDGLEGDDFDVEGPDGLDNEHFQPYKLQYGHEVEYEYDYEDY
ncbi:transcription factor IIIB 60 kDa subunit isoform X2 [Cryptomeria japonica]|uniref:transcription factor IIIB 60 kDa subunit isoform X2 n=1 Tax=Cryptomeria japonica TaxID=3369 RepID=UPI0025ACE3EC|nr:transcription factor IIIB 60 kDa subunit isoform X2 [Cryptomeria japonica]